MNFSRTVALAFAFLALLSFAVLPSEGAPTGGPGCAPSAHPTAANPEWRTADSAPATPPEGVITPLAHVGRVTPTVPEPPEKIATLIKKPEKEGEGVDIWADWQGLDFASTALMYRGVPYRWAGMSSRGMDCSGLIARVMQQHGIRVPHQSSQLFRLGTPVGLGELQAGDLLFFRTRRRGIGHVGMFIGDGKFIHASSGAGRVVITPVSDAHYMAMCVGARRIR